jgi:hypothetical protein
MDFDDPVGLADTAPMPFTYSCKLRLTGSLIPRCSELMSPSRLSAHAPVPHPHCRSANAH